MEVPMRHVTRRSRYLVGLLAIASIVSVGTQAQAATPKEGVVLYADDPAAIASSYIVVFNDTSVTRKEVPNRAADLVGEHKGTLEHVYVHALGGFAAKLTKAAARRIAADSSVKFVEQNRAVYMPSQPISITDAQQNPPSWGLDRIDERRRPLDGRYTYNNTGSGVRVYVIDSGIRLSHNEFGGRAVAGYSSGVGGASCNGHGTHVAGTIGGASHGVAKEVTLVDVQVLDCINYVPWTELTAGVDWVTGDHDPGERAIANLSIGGPPTFESAAFEQAVNGSIGDGITYVVSAGNENIDACNQTPARIPGVITVGATTSGDTRWTNSTKGSNFGSCLDLFAPGDDIRAAWSGNPPSGDCSGLSGSGDSATATCSGTSMAAPHVAGVAARTLAANPSFTPQQVRDKLVNDATVGLVTNRGTGSPNRLLCSCPVNEIAWLEGSNLHTFAGTGLPTVGQVGGIGIPDWAGPGDHNKDGKEDLYWYHGGTDTSIYTLRSIGSRFISAGRVRGPGIGMPSWAGSGDFNGDGYRNEIAWLQGSTLFTFAGTGLSTVGQVGGIGYPDWAGVGDYNRDGKDDLFWYHGGTDGSIYVLRSTGTSFVSIGRIRGPGIGMPSRAATGDFNGDGYRNEIACLQGSTMFTFAGTGLSTVGQVGGIGYPDWAGVGDYTKDGRDDLFWYHAGTDTSIYVLQSTGSSFASIGRVRGPGIGMPTWATTGDFNGS
jgi:subtilisin family serine protease